MGRNDEDEEWDEASARAEWEARHAKNLANPEFMAKYPTAADQTWEDRRGLVRGFAIGLQWEKDVKEYLDSVGVTELSPWTGDVDSWQDESERVLGYVVPPPDLVGIDGWTLELKNQKGAQYATLAKFIDQMIDEQRLTGDPYGAVISKRRGAPIEDAYVVMRLEDWAQFLAEHRTCGRRATIRIT